MPRHISTLLSSRLKYPACAAICCLLIVLTPRISYPCLRTQLHQSGPASAARNARNPHAHPPHSPPGLRAQPLVIAWDPIPVPLLSLVDGPFFLADADRIAAYRIRERVAIVGPATAPIAFPAVFQNGPAGLRVRADAPGGVRLWAEYVVRRRGSGSLKGTAYGAGEEMWSDGEGERHGDGEWEMVEVLRLQGNRMLMPLMKGQMRDAHRDICRKVMEGIVAEGRQRAGDG
ncbi:hypothetical protein ACHAQH_000223 [Verticillium albo-atrum]